MALYRYVKKPLKTVKNHQTVKINLKALSLLLVIVGFFFVANAAYPIVAYQLFVAPRFAQTFVTPTIDTAIAQTFENALSEETGSEINLTDFTKASNWFPQADATFSAEGISNYLLSIPKLGIKEAKVLVGVDDLKKSLIQYPGTSLPGKYGNSVIFGHSVLPQFFNPRNYTAIFSTLPTLRPKDEIIVDYNQIKYRYLIEQMVEVVPNDISILAQRFDDSYLTLITCVPPGTYLRRLIVRARLAKI